MLTDRFPYFKRLFQFTTPCMDASHPDQRIQRDEICFDIPRLAHGLLEMVQRFRFIPQMKMRRADVIQRDGNSIPIARVAMGFESLSK